MVDRYDVSRWLDDYVAAWRSNDRDSIVALFTPDAVYRYDPYADPIVGGEAIAASWLQNPDDPDVWEAEYDVAALDGDTAVAVGTTSYRAVDPRPARTYHNCFILRFAPDGRCRQFTEWYVEQPT